MGFLPVPSHDDSGARDLFCSTFQAKECTAAQKPATAYMNRFTSATAM
jgi:hypothetical protein